MRAWPVVGPWPGKVWPMSLAGRVALVTGAQQGIGAAVATALGAQGTTVVVNYLDDEPAAASVVAAIEAAGGRAVAIAGDVRSRADVTAMVEAGEAFGGVELLVNNAGGPLSRHGATRIVRRLARLAGLDKVISPHSCRHAYVTLSLDAGVPLRDVQDGAGHASPETTRRYDRARFALDRSPTYALASFLGAAS